MAHTEIKESHGTGDLVPPPGEDCNWVQRVLRFVPRAHYRKCEGGQWVEYSEKITHTVTPKPGGSCHIDILTVTTITYTDEPCGSVDA